MLIVCSVLQNFRVNERALQLMEQVSGRAGRKDGEGKVMVQVTNANIRCLRMYRRMITNYFLKMRLLRGNRFFYPPYSRIILITFRHKIKEVVEWAAQFCANNMKNDFGKYMVGSGGTGGQSYPESIPHGIVAETPHEMETSLPTCKACDSTAGSHAAQ